MRKQRRKMLITMLAGGIVGGEIATGLIYLIGWPTWEGWRSVVASGIGMSAALLLIAISSLLIWFVRDCRATHKARIASNTPKSDRYECPVECQEVWQ